MNFDYAVFVLGKAIFIERKTYFAQQIVVK